MKIFDFTNGVKGEFLGEVQLPSSMGATLSGSSCNGSDWIHITISGCSFHNSAHIEMRDWSEKPILPSDYDVQAICFCTGKTNKGSDFGSTWDWNFLATPEWLTKNGYPTEDGISLLQKTA